MDADVAPVIGVEGGSETVPRHRHRSTGATRGRVPCSARLADELVGGARRLAAELVEDVRICLQRLGRGMAELRGEVDDRHVLLADAQRRERVAQVVGPRRAEVQRLRRGVEAAVAPVVVVVELPDLVARVAEEDCWPGGRCSA
jgi:hypothetical protein